MAYHNIVFVSEATVDLSEQDLLLMLKQSRAEQQRAQFTGLLLYNEGQFLQVLEGSEASLREYFNRIAAQPYHCKLQKLADGPKDQRDFPGWYVSFVRSKSGPPLPNYLALPEVRGLVRRTSMQHLLEGFLAESNTVMP